jgi:hypothetical protein
VVERQDLVVRGVAIHKYRMAKVLDLPAPHLIWSGWPELTSRLFVPKPSHTDSGRCCISQSILEPAAPPEATGIGPVSLGIRQIRVPDSPGLRTRCTASDLHGP